MRTFSSSLPRPICLSDQTGYLLPLHTVQSTRLLEQEACLVLPQYALMQRAGLAIARIALAVAPNAETVWIVCGPGNNGGDGLQAAAFLQQWGKTVQATLLAIPEQLPADAHNAYVQAVQSGVKITSQPPKLTCQDLCVDALLGIGASRAPSAAMLTLVQHMRNSAAPTLAVDLPTGLHANTGALLNGVSVHSCVKAKYTVTLLTLKPGLFTGYGREAAGAVWWDDLGISDSLQTPEAWLQGTNIKQRQAPETDKSTATGLPRYDSHKGCFGDVCVIGGDTGMQGAALLAGEAALYSGAGRVYIGLLQTGMFSHDAALMVRFLTDTSPPEIMPYKLATTVCGCGGGHAIDKRLPDLLHNCQRLVLDADALNAIAANKDLQNLLQRRAAAQSLTILTPHPLEAARLLQCSSSDIQRDRIAAARLLACRYQSMVVLKGSGSVCALPDTFAIAHERYFAEAPSIENASVNIVLNYSGNARLATAGTGDVLAGCIAAYWAQAHALLQNDPVPPSPWNTAWSACCAAVHAHGRVADTWKESIQGAFTAQRLAQSLFRPTPEGLAPYAARI